jgi:multiple sugar transport system substrate-binding protein
MNGLMFKLRKRRLKMIRAGIIAGVAMATVVLAAACTPGSGAPGVAATAPEPSGTVQFWHQFTDRESEAIASVIADFQTKYPKVHVDVTDGQDDDKTLQAIGAGNGPDIAMSFSTDRVGKFCASGAWVDLKPYVDRDKVDLNQIPGTVRSYTEFRGKRCAMPFLADSYGFYYNKKMLADAGFSAPPKTLSELSTMAKALTVRAADGTIERAGFLPQFGFYEFSPAHMAPATGATWFTGDGKSNLAGDPAWQEIMKWQKDLVDWYGYKNLAEFTAGLGDEFSADHAFHKGQVAMMLDGEWRVAFLRDQAPDLEFGTAPMPVADSKANRYGAGYVTGSIIGVAKTAKNPEAAWALTKYLTTDADAVAKLAVAIKNVPTTAGALTAATELTSDPQFKVFLDIFNNQGSVTMPATAVGAAVEETFNQFLTQWQSGSATDLKSGLSDVDKQINQLIELAG